MMAEYTFTFAIAQQPDGLTDTIVGEALYGAGVDDCLVSLQYGRVWVDFDREAESLLDAVLSAVRHVESAGFTVESLDDTGLVSQSDIAERIGKTRAQVGNYVAGRAKAYGHFPAPIAHLGPDSRPHWRWEEVAAWLAEHKLASEEVARDAADLAAVRAALDHRSRARTRLKSDRAREIEQAFVR